MISSGGPFYCRNLLLFRSPFGHDGDAVGNLALAVKSLQASLANAAVERARLTLLRNKFDSTVTCPTTGTLNVSLFHAFVTLRHASSRRPKQ